VLKNFIGYHQSTFQVLKIDFILFGILILEIIFALILLHSGEESNLEYMASYIFISVGICALILSLVILFCTSKYFFNQPK
jgi:Na+-transporting NADH:ubiquinone oxidoreductase subunit NqrB